jgi:hypothetical protein
MQKAPRAAKQVKNEDEVIDQGISQLLRAVKTHAKSKGKPVKRSQLLKDGYSERFIAKVEKA